MLNVKRITAPTALTTLMLLAAALPAAAQETYSTWSNHKFIGLNTHPHAGGAGVATPVRNFPVLVRLDSTNFATGFAQSVGRGADLRFTKLGDVTRLQHQIERWDSAAKKAEVWVKLDTVYGSGVTSFRMHWGKAGAADSSRGTSVFDTAQGFQAVYHMNEIASDSARDATSNRFHGAPSNSPASTAGVAGPGRSFDGTSQHFEVPNSASGKLNFPIDGVFTLSAWAFIDPSSAVVDRVIAAKHDDQYALKISTNNRWQFFEFDDSWSTVGIEYESGRWTHLTGVLNGRDTYMYVDGNEVESIIDCCGGGGNRNETSNFFIGRAGESARRWWFGYIDELRVANVARSADWARLEFNNQRLGSTMMIYADTLPVVSLAAGQADNRLGRVQTSANGVRFRMTGVAQARFDVTTPSGRVVWSHTAVTRDGIAEAMWRHGAARGVYLVRMSGLDTEGRTLRTENARFSVTK